MKNRAKQYENHLRKSGLLFLKMSVSSSSELLEAAKEVIEGGKTKYVEYKENELVYDTRLTKLGTLRKDIKNGDVSEISKLYYELNKGKYTNKPFQGMLIERLDKPDKPRMIKIPAVADRIVYSLLLKRVEPFFEKDIQKYPIYGLKNKGVSLAISKLAPMVTAESVVLKLDIQSYFDTIPRAKLMEMLRKYKLGGEELKLIKAAIHAPTKIPKTPKDLARKHGHKFKPYETEIGLPQGCAFSPLLASIYALDVERYLKEKDVFSIRYIDDVIVITEDIEAAKALYEDLKAICDGLGLTMHPPEIGKVNDKSYIAKANQPIRFLGLDIIDGAASLPDEKIDRFIKVLRERLGEKLKNEDDIDYRDSCIISFIMGWTRYYREHAEDWGKHKNRILSEGTKTIVESEVEDSTKSRFELILRRELDK